MDNETEFNLAQSISISGLLSPRCLNERVRNAIKLDAEAEEAFLFFFPPFQNTFRPHWVKKTIWEKNSHFHFY